MTICNWDQKFLFNKNTWFHLKHEPYLVLDDSTCILIWDFEISELYQCLDPWLHTNSTLDFDPWTSIYPLIQQSIFDTFSVMLGRVLGSILTVSCDLQLKLNVQSQACNGAIVLSTLRLRSFGVSATLHMPSTKQRSCTHVFQCICVCINNNIVLNLWPDCAYNKECGVRWLEKCPGFYAER